MGVIFRQSLLTTIILYLGAVIGYLNVLYLFPKFLTFEQMGTIRTIQDMALLLSPIAQFGFTASYLKFSPSFASDRQKSKGFLGFMFLASMVSFVLFVIAFFLLQSHIVSYFKTNAEAIVHYLPHTVIIIGLFVIYRFFASHAQSLLKITPGNFINDVLQRLLLSALIILYLTKTINFDQLITGLVFVYAAMLIAISLYLIRIKSFSFSLNFHLLEKRKMYELLQFALFSVLGTSAFFIIGKIDSLMISGMLGLDQNGLYTTVFYIAVIIEFPKRAINQISTPLISRYFDKGELNKVEDLYKSTSINQSIAGSALLLLILINLENIFNLMPKGDEFRTISSIVYIVGAGRLIDMIFGVNSEILTMSKHYRLNLVLLIILAGLTILLNLVLIPEYGVFGAAIGSAGSLILFNLGKYLVIWFKLGIQPFHINTLKVLMLFGAIYFLTMYTFSFENSYIDILIKSSFSLILFGAGILILKPSADLSELLGRLKFRNNEK